MSVETQTHCDVMAIVSKRKVAIRFSSQPGTEFHASPEEARKIARQLLHAAYALGIDEPKESSDGG